MKSIQNHLSELYNKKIEDELETLEIVDEMLKYHPDNKSTISKLEEEFKTKSNN